MPWRRPMRWWRHLVADPTSVRRVFNAEALGRIEETIAAGEQVHRGQVCFAVEGGLPLGRVMRRLAPRERALEVFGLLRVWDTEENCGVLLYLLLADHDVEIVADRGIHARVGAAAWEAICRKMEAGFRDRRYAETVEAGIADLNALLARHFPHEGAAGRNELPDRPVVL